MTRKEKKEEIKPQEVTKNKKNKNQADKVENADETQEIKLIECGEDQKVLEFYSKDDLCAKVKELELDIEKFQDKSKKLQKESEDWKGKFMRLQAEFENAQKRWNKNRQNLRIEYIASTLKSFLPLYDSFNKALADEGNKEAIKGFYDQFMNILKSYKAEPIKIEENEQFDYSVHEALSTIEKEDVPNNTIIDVIQEGWKLDKDIIRYAKVIISREPKPPEPEPQIEPECVKTENSDETLEEDSSKIEDKQPDYIS